MHHITKSILIIIITVDIIKLTKEIALPHFLFIKFIGFYFIVFSILIL